MDLKLFRKLNKIPRQEIAELFGCSLGHLSNIEVGNRRLTVLQMKLLVEKYGYEAVSQYAEPSEMPKPTIHIDLPQIKDNAAPVQNGNGNSMGADKDIIDKLLADQAEKNKQINDLLKQQARLIELLAQMGK